MDAEVSLPVKILLLVVVLIICGYLGQAVLAENSYSTDADSGQVIVHPHGFKAATTPTLNTE